MACPSCREPAQFPWEHAPDCVEGLRHQLRWYGAGIPVVLMLLIGETVPLVVAFVMMGR